MLKKLFQRVFANAKSNTRLKLRSNSPANVKFVNRDLTILARVKKVSGQDIHLYLSGDTNNENLNDQDIVCTVLQGNLEYVIDGVVTKMASCHGDKCIVINVRDYKTYENKRRFKRYNVNYIGHMTFLGEGAVIPVSIKNISLGGALLTLTNTFDDSLVGKEAMVYIEAGEHRPNLKSKILSVRADEHAVSLGIEFWDENEYNKELMNEIVLSLENEFNMLVISLGM